MALTLPASFGPCSLSPQASQVTLAQARAEAKNASKDLQARFPAGFGLARSVLLVMWPFLISVQRLDCEFGCHSAHAASLLPESNTSTPHTH